jgi:hypothetical protein
MLTPDSTTKAEGRRPAVERRETIMPDVGKAFRSTY